MKDKKNGSGSGSLMDTTAEATNEVIAQGAPDIPPGGLTRKMLEDKLTVMPSSSITRDLLHSGDNPEDLWMRTVIKHGSATNKAESKLDAALLYFALCDEFDDEDGKQYIRRKLAGWASIDGIAREQAVSAAIGERFRQAAARAAAGDKPNGPPKVL
ncbi:hypothetical protein [Dehalogenimonas alkenigignens]|uniref:hypothetical protein n=1 Tax=Dehalogenimonas alkenigignens TaxID=1217799 RepID=UPI000D563906|nr:hypothetical protein [Dehalogenimonas alkenigignens]PVV83513.1 hypothetical protein DD509_06700 [Dehalogenimonas alkenigignens]